MSATRCTWTADGGCTRGVVWRYTFAIGDEKKRPIEAHLCVDHAARYAGHVAIGTFAGTMSKL